MKILVTGNAGFIGFHTTLKLFQSRSNTVVGIDSLNQYYDLNLKVSRLKELSKISKIKKINYKFYKLNLTSIKSLEKICKKYRFDRIVHLAAQPGVRYSLINPKSYIDNNLVGFFNILECSKKFKIKHLIYASSSSVYGDGLEQPSRESSETSKPLQLYAATKKSNEVMAYAYSNLYKIPMTCLRFFTVYGPWGRPDMALFKFTKSIIENKTINLHNYGNHSRDYTYVEDIVAAIKKLVNKGPSKINRIPHQIFNIGNGNTVKLKTFIKILEKKLNKKAKIKMLKIQPGEILNTHSDTKLLSKKINYKSKIPFEKGVQNFLIWYKNFYQINK